MTPIPTDLTEALRANRVACNELRTATNDLIHDIRSFRFELKKLTKTPRSKKVKP